MEHAILIIARVELDVKEAQDNLFAAKTSQADQVNKRRSPEVEYQVGDLVLLSTLNRRKEFTNTGKRRVAKFIPRYDGPYEIVNAHSETSNYTLDMPNSPNTFPTFHAGVLKKFVSNDPQLFPSRELNKPEPVIVDGEEEHFIEAIVDERRRGRGYQYLVSWVGEGPEQNRWIAGSGVNDTEALDIWLKKMGCE